MMHPRAKQRLLAGMGAILFVGLLLALWAADAELTRTQFREARFAAALLFAGTLFFCSGFFRERIQVLPRAGVAVAALLLSYWLSPVALVSRTYHHTQQSVLYFHIGEIVNAQGRDISNQFELAVNEILRKHGAPPQQPRAITFSDEETALWHARETLAELRQVAKEGHYKNLRIGLDTGSVRVQGSSMDGPALAGAKQLAESEFLDQIGLSSGIFVTEAVFGSLKETIRQEYGLTQLAWKTSAGAPIYSVALAERQTPSGSLRQVNQQLSSYDGVFIVSINSLLSDMRRDVNKDQVDLRLKWIIDSHLGALLASLNRYEGAFPGAMCYLLFPTAEQALRTGEHLLNATRDSPSWDDVLVVKVNIGLHQGRLEVGGGGYFGSTIEKAKKLTKEGLGGEGITLSEEAFSSVRPFLKARSITPVESPQLGKLYFYKPPAGG